MEHYITEIRIDKLRHLSNIVISLNPKERQHLLITGKNGSGKTSLLLALEKYLCAINDGHLNDLTGTYIQLLANAEKRISGARSKTEKYDAEKDYDERKKFISRYKDGVDILFNESEDLDSLYAKGEFVTAFFPAHRQAVFVRGSGAENVRLDNSYRIDSEPGELLLKYMVHLKTQQSYAKNEGDIVNVERIQAWFDRFENALKTLLDDESVSLRFNYKEYDFTIYEDGREPFSLDKISDGYSSAIYIVSNIIMRMDKNWLLGENLSKYDVEGIVLIDELETHLHIELQKKIMPFLTTFFPKVQFIVTTHSPYILNSVSSAKAYDLERCVELENLTLYSADGLAEGYFGAEEYSDELRTKIEEYRNLTDRKELTAEERARRAQLRCELKDIPRGFSQEAREVFEEIEGNNYDKG